MERTIKFFLIPVSVNSDRYLFFLATHSGQLLATERLIARHGADVAAAGWDHLTEGD